MAKMKDTSGDLADGRAYGIDNLLYSADAEFRCAATLLPPIPAVKIFGRSKGQKEGTRLKKEKKTRPSATSKTSPSAAHI